VLAIARTFSQPLAFVTEDRLEDYSSGRPEREHSSGRRARFK
jgi:hypothetical protein